MKIDPKIILRLRAMIEIANDNNSPRILQKNKIKYQISTKEPNHADLNSSKNSIAHMKNKYGSYKLAKIPDKIETQNIYNHSEYNNLLNYQDYNTIYEKYISYLRRDLKKLPKKEIKQK